MKKIGITMLAILLVGLAATGVSAFGGQKFLEKNPELETALQNNDYNAFVQGVEDIPRIKEHLTQDRFDHMVAMYNWKNQVKEALDANDYGAWKEAHDNKPKQLQITDFINEDNFDRFVELHEARQNGDQETAKEIAEELGLPQKGPRRGFMQGNGRGMHQKNGQGNGREMSSNARGFGLQNGQGFGQGGYGPRGMGSGFNQQGGY